MRYKLKPRPRDGDRKLVSKFLWWPMKCGLDWRWLERATIVYGYHYSHFEGGTWFPVRFAD